MPLVKMNTPEFSIEKPTLIYAFSRFVVFLFFRIWARLEIQGLENVPKAGAVLVAANHASYTDPPLVGASIPRVLHFLAKKELFRFPPFGALISSLNAHPLNRSAGASGLKAAEALFRRGYAVIMFPEGKRVKGGELAPPKPGLGLLAKRAGVPILPVYIHNSNRVLSFAKVKVRIGSLIYVDKEKDHRGTGDKVMAAIAALKAEVKNQD